MVDRASTRWCESNHLRCLVKRSADGRVVIDDTSQPARGTKAPSFLWPRRFVAFLRESNLPYRDLYEVAELPDGYVVEENGEPVGRLSSVKMVKSWNFSTVGLGFDFHDGCIGIFRAVEFPVCRSITSVLHIFPFPRMLKLMVNV